MPHTLRRFIAVLHPECRVTTTPIGYGFLLYADSWSKNSRLTRWSTWVIRKLAFWIGMGYLFYSLNSVPVDWECKGTKFFSFVKWLAKNIFFFLDHCLLCKSLRVKRLASHFQWLSPMFGSAKVGGFRAFVKGCSQNKSRPYRVQPGLAG